MTVSEATILLIWSDRNPQGYGLTHALSTVMLNGQFEPVSTQRLQR